MDARIRRIVVGVHGSVGSLQALRRGVAEARQRAVPVWSVLAWTPPGGDTLNRQWPCPALLRIWTEQAGRRLHTAWQEALGGAPADVDVRLLAVWGPAGEALVRVAADEADLLVVGSGARGLMSVRRSGPVARYCLARAQCCVLAVPPPPLARQWAHRGWLRRRWMVREPLDHPAG